ncbi:TRAP transporter small permease subunit [Ancylobacter mangrovi]|uniref:TRAP transporter small permease subunit n=1 Tax=Ancylobacter mangrovi TaxID=2972472 RepID=UPI0021627771|nr:TRAP transporter small permease [Ancylobacter mangrovi]MCS0501553.1 TRAP transporter small permease subunit [Ancylobacter mangrovi]
MISRLLDIVARVLTTASATIVAILAVPVAYDAISRSLRHPSVWVFDVSLYLMIAAAFLGNAYALRCGSHFRMMMFVDMAGPKVRHWADRFAFLVTFLFALAMAWLSAGYVAENYEMGFTSGTLFDAPLWIAQLAMPLGGLSLAVEALRRLLLDDYPDVLEG